MSKKTKVCKGLLMLAFGGELALSALSALAQETATLDRVEITGSSIKRLAAEQSLPVTVLKADDLAKAGVSNAEQVMTFIAANQSSTTTTNSVGASTGGAAYANLRGLGDSRTLVLVNGKRMVNNPYSAAAVDLNALPFGSIDRVEVLTDGASAIYGTDAIAGVINFITRKEYQGVGLSADGSWPTASGGGQTYDFGISGGIGSLSEQGWNVFGGVSYRQQNVLRSKDRSFANTAYIPSQGIDNTSGRTSPATYTQGSGAWNPSLPGCNPPGSINIGGGCYFDYVTQIDLIPKQEQISLLAKGSYAVNKDNTVSLEYLQANNKVAVQIAPASIPGMTMGPTSPYFPGNGSVPANTDPAFDPTQPISVTWRLTGAGNRQSEFTNDTYRVLANWDGQYKGWDYSASLFQSKSTVTYNFTGGYVNSDNIVNGIAGTNGAPYLNPFGPQSDAGAAFIQSSQLLGEVQKATGTLNSFLANTSGEIYKLPAGSMILAVGVEFKTESNNYTNNFALSRPAASSGIAGAEDISGNRRDNAIMAELNIPIVKELDVNLAIRYDDYSDFGSTTNPKASFRWQPTQALLFRGSYNTGFRAPTLQDSYAPNSVTYTGNKYDDAILCPNGKDGALGPGGVATRDCNQQFQQQQGGNPNLKPETSKAWSVGFAVQPVASTTIGLDYWNYNVANSIGVTGENVIMGDQTKYANLIVRCSQLAPDVAATYDNCKGLTTGDPIAYFVNTQLNLGNYKTSGIDITGTWQSAASDYGRFNIGYRGTYVMTYEYQLENGGAYFNNLGVYFNGNPVARYKQVMNFGWQYGAWAAQLINRYSGSYQDESPDVNGNPRSVAGTNTWDLAVTWSGVKGLAVTAGLTNMFNQIPPFSNQASGFQVGYDQRYASPIGRAFLLRGTYQF